MDPQQVVQLFEIRAFICVEKSLSKKTSLPLSDMTMTCCLPEQYDQTEERVHGKRNLQGLALATCCHHLCQWKHYASNTLF